MIINGPITLRTTNIITQSERVEYWICANILNVTIRNFPSGNTAFIGKNFDWSRGSKCDNFGRVSKQ